MIFKRAIIILIVFQAALGAMAIINYGYSLETLQAVTRYSGRLSLVIFSIIFLYQYKPASYPWLSDKPYHIFAIAHGIHLAELACFVILSGAELILYRLAGGFLAYALIFAMPFLVYQLEAGAISEKKFTTIQTVYHYYLWFIFFMTYLPRVRGTLPHVGGTYSEHVILLGWVALMLGMKLPQLLFKKH
jgi:hypothetical protein